MKRILSALLLATILLLTSCRKEELSATPEKTPNIPATGGITGKAMRMDCEPFPMGILTLNTGNISTSYMNIAGDMGYSRNLINVSSNNLLLNGSCFVHTTGNLLSSVNYLLPGIITQTSSAVDWKLDESNENATTLSALYGSWAGMNLGNLNNSTQLVSTTSSSGKPNTIINVNNMNYNGKILTLVGNVSSDDGFIINVSGNFSFQNSEIKLVNMRPERVLFNFPNATNVQIKSGSKFRGTILCPAGTVTYASPTSFEGSIVAKAIDASASSLNILGNPTFIQKTYCNGYQWEGTGECTPNTITTELIAGQTINAGDITVTNDGLNLMVTYNTSNGWKMTGIHLYVGSYELIPMSGGGAIPGQFPYNIPFTQPLTTYTVTIPLSSLPECFFVAAHANLKKGNQTETGWGKGAALPGSNWGMYFNYCKTECAP